MRTPWNSPVLNTLTGEDAARLRQVFISLSAELSDVYKELDSLKRLVASLERRAYGIRR